MPLDTGDGAFFVGGEGTFKGDLVGETVGGEVTFNGDLVGESVGGEVTFNGDLVGESVGGEVTFNGDTVGVNIGDEVGEGVVSNVDGAELGDKDGAADGDALAISGSPNTCAVPITASLLPGAPTITA